MQYLLLIEPNEDIQKSIRKSIARLPHVELMIAPNISAARELIASRPLQEIDLLLLDAAIPDGDGLRFLSELIQEDDTNDVPVIIISQKDDLAAKIAAFSLGVEDFLVFPIHPVELGARLEMRLKKRKRKKHGGEVIHKGGLLLQLSLLRAFATIRGTTTQLDLTTKEFKILAFLALNEGRVYSRTQLVRAVWGDSIHVLDRTIDSHICAIRRKLRGLASHIECVPGAGYRFCVATTTGVPAAPSLQPDSVVPTA